MDPPGHLERAPPEWTHRCRLLACSNLWRKEDKEDEEEEEEDERQRPWTRFCLSAGLGEAEGICTERLPEF